MNIGSDFPENLKAENDVDTFPLNYGCIFMAQNFKK